MSKKTKESKMNSKMPMIPMAVNLSSPDLCAIIDQCGKSGVRVFKSGDLYLAFGPAPEKIIAEYPMVVAGVPNHAQQNADTLARDEEEIRAEQLRMLMIENPVEYERQLRDGELSDESRESELDE